MTQADAPGGHRRFPVMTDGKHRSGRRIFHGTGGFDGYTNTLGVQRLLKRSALDAAHAQIQNMRNRLFRAVYAHLRIGGQPVSYTHLTLPTNREV